MKIVFATHTMWPAYGRKPTVARAIERPEA